MTTTMKKVRLTVLIFCMLLFSATAHAGTFFVNREAPSAGNGTSWATAFTTVTQALNAAKDGDQIWVAEGTYFPTKTTDRNATFRLKPGVALLGGFSGTETELKKRNFKKHLTILSGDIGDIGVPDDNVFHVVTGSDNSALDGFTITGGYSLNTPWTSGKILTPQSLTAGPQAGFGAGMLNFQASPEIRNCIFQDNHALMGGAVYTMTARADTPAAKPTVSPKFTECTFWQNSALGHGGGVVNTLRTAPMFVSCVFDSNICDISGGGMFNDFGAAPMLLNSIFRNNEAKFGGGMANEGASTPILYYSTFTGNRSLKTGPAIYQGAKSANTTILTKTVVWGNECECDDTRFFNGPPSVIRVQDSVIQNGYKGKSVFRANPGLDRKSETMLNVGYKTNGHRFRPSKLPHRLKDVAHFPITANLPAYDDKYVSTVSPELLKTIRTQTPTAPAKAVAPTSTPNVASAPQTTATLPATTLQTATTPAPVPTSTPAVPVAATPETISPVPAPQAEKTHPQPAQPKQQAMLTPPSSGLKKSAESKPDKSPSNVEVLMLNLDRDGNGCVTINEVTDDMKPKFWRLDRNGDNCLSKIELAKTVAPKTRPQPQTIPSATTVLAPQAPIRKRQPQRIAPAPRQVPAPKPVPAPTPVAKRTAAPAPVADPAGYTLFSPVGSQKTLLVDMQGKTVKTWHGSDQSTGAAYLLNNGNLLRSVSPPPGEVRTPFRGEGVTGGIIQEISPRGQIVWEYTYISDTVRQHHDIAPLPNGNVLILAWELKTESDLAEVGGSVRNHPDGVVWAEHIVEVRKSGPRSGYIVWEWHAWDHLVQNADDSAPNFANPVRLPQRMDINYNPTRKPQWLNATSIDYNPQLRQIVLSLSGTGEVWIIDHSTKPSQSASNSGGMMHRGGDILFRWGNPQAYGASGRPELVAQRDARWVHGNQPGKETILIFNNGDRRTQQSDIVEIRPEYYFKSTRIKANVLWSYNNAGGKRFFADKVSGAQRLANGNTLICEGSAGRIVEVSDNAKPVWEYAYTTQGGANKRIFRATRIPSTHPGLRRLSIN